MNVHDVYCSSMLSRHKHVALREFFPTKVDVIDSLVFAFFVQNLRMWKCCLLGPTLRLAKAYARKSLKDALQRYRSGGQTSHVQYSLLPWIWSFQRLDLKISSQNSKIFPAFNSQIPHLTRRVSCRRELVDFRRHRKASLKKCVAAYL